MRTGQYRACWRMWQCGHSGPAYLPAPALEQLVQVANNAQTALLPPAGEAELDPRRLVSALLARTCLTRLHTRLHVCICWTVHAQHACSWLVGHCRVTTGTPKPKPLSTLMRAWYTQSLRLVSRCIPVDELFGRAAEPSPCNNRQGARLTDGLPACGLQNETLTRACVHPGAPDWWTPCPQLVMPQALPRG